MKPFLAVIFTLFTTFFGVGQTEDSTLVDNNISDSLVFVTPNSDVQHTIKYIAKDSMRFNVKTQTVFLFSDATLHKDLSKIEYDDISLEASYIELNWATNVLTAKGMRDSTGEYIGRPIFIDGDEQFKIDTIKYNFNNEKAIIYGPFNELTGQQGSIKGDKAFLNEDKELYIEDGIYCPCEDADASTYIKSKKIKVIPEKRVYTGPFNLWIADIPTPLGFPFGIFPITDKKTAGLIIPYYGESVERGLFLRNGGYFLPIGDRVSVKLLGEIYSKGGWGLNNFIDYKTRYRFDGSINLRYNKRIANSDEPSRSVTQDFWFNWKHNPVSLKGNRFSASVNGGTSSYNSNNSFSFDNALSSTFQSNISYYMPFSGTPFSLSVNLRHNQNTQTEIVNFTLPEVSFAMNRVYPFKSKNHLGKKGGGRKFLESINTSYRMDAKMFISNQEVNTSLGNNVVVIDQDPLDSLLLEVRPENFDALMDRAQYGVRHTIPISSSFKVGAFNLSPSFNYTEIWYPNKWDYTYNTTDQVVNAFSDNGFTRTSYYTTGVGINTRLYGMYSAKKNGQEAYPKVRHTITPNVSFSYTPDFSNTRQYNGYKDVQLTDSTFGTLSRYQGYLYGGPGNGESKSMSFSIANILEMKTLNKKDTTSENNVKSFKLLDNFSISSSYNFAADEFNLRPFALNARTTLFEALNFNFVGTLDPYLYVRDTAGNQTKINKFAWQHNDVNQEVHTKGIGQFSYINMSAGITLNPNLFKTSSSDKDSPEEQERNEIVERNPDMYVDFTIPWSLSLRYNYDIRQVGFNDPDVRQSLTFNGTLGITKKWNFNYGFNYDFVNKEVVYPRLAVSRDLGCWAMNFNWIMSGTRESYFFEIYIKSDLLKDLKLSRRRSWYDR